jgi:hypothetical protein
MDYVPDWTYKEAIREIFQNAIDRRTVNPNSDWYYDYNVGSHCLTITSSDSFITRSSLIIGNSTKREDDTTIGKYGEGYKIGLLVLVRNKHTVTVDTGRCERWYPIEEYSEEYQQSVLSIHLEATPDYLVDHVRFKIGGITPEMYSELQKINLNLSPYPTDVIKTSKCNILIDPQFKGHIFVSGLLIQVSKDEKMAFGYDIKPQYITLDRDRKLIADFDLLWLTSGVWLESKDSPRLIEMAKFDVSDIKYINHKVTKGNNEEHSTNALLEFKRENGENAYPVVSQYDMDRLHQINPKAKPVIVSSSYYSLISSGSHYQSPRATVIIKSPQEILKENLLTKTGRVKKNCINIIPRIIDLAKDWKS